MASNFYGVNLDQPLEKVVVATSTNSSDIELRVDLTKVATKQQVFEAVESIQNALLRFAFP